MVSRLHFLPTLIVLVVVAALAAVSPLRVSASAARAPGDPAIHVVAAGETLSGIAQRYGLTPQAIVAANRLPNPDVLQIGQRLTIPAGTPAKAPAAEVPERRFILAPLRPNDTLAAIARRYQVTLNELMEANYADRPLDLMASSEIRIPVKVLPSLPAPFVLVEPGGPVPQGRTGVVRVTMATQNAPGGAFLDRPLSFAYDRKTPHGYRYWALLPTSAITSVGEALLTLRFGDAQVVQPVRVAEGSYDTQHIVLPPSKGGLLAADKTKPELDRLMALWTTHSDQQQWQGALRFPIADGFSQTSPYGTRRSYNGGPVSSYHGGTDWGAPEGTPIIAPGAGTVLLAEPLEVRGGAVIIDHGMGVTSNFWHMSRIDVKPGDKVKPGQVLGHVGTTGLSTAAHLHWEIRVDAIAVDPLQWTTVNFPYLAERSDG